MIWLKFAATMPPSPADLVYQRDEQQIDVMFQHPATLVLCLLQEEGQQASARQLQGVLNVMRLCHNLESGDT